MPMRGNTSIMVEWETGLGWLIAVIVAAFATRFVVTQHAQPIGNWPAGWFTDVAPLEISAPAGWPPGSRPPGRARIGPLAALHFLAV
jgi:hypothetical protein